MKPAKNTETLFFSGKVYSAEAVKLAAAVFESRGRAVLAPAPGGLNAEVSGPEHAAGEFANEALNQQCRIDLWRRNSRIASIIGTKALLSAAGGKPAKRAGTARRTRQ